MEVEVAKGAHEVSTMDAQQKFWRAFLAAQRTMTGASKDRKNDHFKSKYATLESVIEACKGPLNDNGLVFSQRIGSVVQTASGVGLIEVHTLIVHADTGFCGAESRMDVPLKDPSDPQKAGSAITYGKRYSLLAILGLPTEDDDGNAATKAPELSPIDKLSARIKAAKARGDVKELNACLVETETLNLSDNYVAALVKAIKELESK
jgi:hypothetical protein